MPDGVVTRSQSHNLHPPNDPAISDTLNNHEDILTAHTKILEGIQASIKDLHIAIARQEKAPALLPTPTLQSTPTLQPPFPQLTHAQPSTQHPTIPPDHIQPLHPFHPPFSQNSQQSKQPKLDLPPFHGNNVADWLFQINHFFSFHSTPEEHKLHIAAFYMTGPALQWFHWMHKNHQLSSWHEFVKNLELRFGPSAYQHPEASLYKLRQRTTVTAYLSEFENLSNRAVRLSHDNLLNCFLSGLRDDIRRELYLFQPVSLHEAIGLAKLVEEKCDDSRRSWFRPNLPKPPTHIAAITQPPQDPLPHRLPIRKLTATEMATRKEKGLCFNCDEQFTPGHRCNKPKFLCLLINDPEECDSDDPYITDYPPLPLPDLNPNLSANHPHDINPDISNPTISLHALEGHNHPSTIRIQTSINGKTLIALIDGGSTHNFMQQRLAKHLAIPIEPSRHLSVTVGNGDSLSCEGFCSQVPVVMNEQHFNINFHLLPIYGADIVLGVDWLASLGRILFDYNELWLRFTYKGTELTLTGRPKPTCAQLTLSQVHRLNTTHGSASYFHLTAYPITTNLSHTAELPSIPETLEPTFKSHLHKLISHYSALFQPPKGLPPHRNSDHRIPLIPNSTPVKVRPYRYPHFQKAEIERLITEML